MTYIATPRSSNVAGYDYDPDTRDLHVTFNTGHSGTYHGVSQTDVDALADAPSIGSYLQQHIRAMYPYTRG